jgi:putative flippase GtrA
MTSVAVSNGRERGRFMRFAVVGVIGAVVDFGVMNLLVWLLDASLVFAGTVSFIAAIISNFTWNRFWTYPDSRSKPIARQMVQFSLVSVAGLVIRLPILHYVEPLMDRLFETLRLPVFEPHFFAKNFTLALAVIIVMFWNFFINRYWTYNDVE